MSDGDVTSAEVKFRNPTAVVVSFSAAQYAVHVCCAITCGQVVRAPLG